MRRDRALFANKNNVPESLKKIGMSQALLSLPELEIKIKGGPGSMISNGPFNTVHRLSPTAW